MESWAKNDWIRDSETQGERERERERVEWKWSLLHRLFHRSSSVSGVRLIAGSERGKLSHRWYKCDDTWKNTVVQVCNWIWCTYFHSHLMCVLLYQLTFYPRFSYERAREMFYSTFPFTLATFSFFSLSPSSLGDQRFPVLVTECACVCVCVSLFVSVTIYFPSVVHINCTSDTGNNRIKKVTHTHTHIHTHTHTHSVTRTGNLWSPRLEGLSEKKENVASTFDQSSCLV